MDDLGGLGKVADSKLVNKLYDDTASSSAKELGKLGADVTKTLRLFTAPFQLAALAQDRFEVWLNEARNRVPEDRQVTAPAHIAGPALKAMLFMEQDSPHAKYFVNLLSRAIDKSTVNEVHPAFVHLLEQISPDEALLLYKLQDLNIAGVGRLHHIGVKDEDYKMESLTSFDQSDFAIPSHLSMYFEHLETMNLVRDLKEDTIEIPEDKPMWKSFRWYGLTEFGTQFLNVCISDSHV
ncbi:Abi-alpha family protein [Vibrio parahaemolyticus]|uniref:Abi-alpha family protein n=1 Tax=Vibrio parahaemolyticus TaxID=670 RepID=UPI001120A7D8|nr:Abi-alpha family protein [Vibrio parahaemolyticus]TOA11487.1 hypothetical protein CGK33_23440 [Vibrio parahaemolyticus]